MAAAGSRAVYDILVAAHVVCAVIGFGSLAISGVYGFTSRRPSGPDAVDEARRYFRAPGRVEWLVLAVPFLGAGALAVEPGGRGVGQLWAGLAAVVWLGAATVLIKVVRPAEARLREALAGPQLDRPGLARAGARLGWAGVVTDLAFFAGLMLMVLQPR